MESFGEDIGRQNITSKVSGVNDPRLEGITYQVAVNFNTFRPFVENRIPSNVNGSLTITVKRNRT